MSDDFWESVLGEDTAAMQRQLVITAAEHQLEQARGKHFLLQIPMEGDYLVDLLNAYAHWTYANCPDCWGSLQDFMDVLMWMAAQAALYEGAEDGTTQLFDQDESDE